MDKSGIARLAALAVVCGAPALVAACSSGITYGTGTSTEMQTLQDISGILSLTGEKKPEVDRSPRGGIVAPPTTEAGLPPPVDETTTASIDWPNDPDEARRRRQAEEENTPIPQSSLATVRDPGFRLPKEAFENQDETEDNWDYGKGPNPKFIGAGAKKHFVEMKAERGGSVDVAGNPTRRYLTEPPAEYRVPDPNAPVDPEAPPEPKKSFKLSDLWPF